MSIQRVDRDELATRAVGILGLDEGVVDLFSMEGICASLRRAASFLCPASPRQIVDSVLGALTSLHPDLERDEINKALDVLVGAGDLLELRPSGVRTRLIFLGRFPDRAGLGAELGVDDLAGRRRLACAGSAAPVAG